MLTARSREPSLTRALTNSIHRLGLSQDLWLSTDGVCYHHERFNCFCGRPSSDRRPGTSMCVTRTYHQHGAIGFPPRMQQTATCFLSLIAALENRHFRVRRPTSERNLSRPLPFGADDRSPETRLKRNWRNRYRSWRNFIETLQRVRSSYKSRRDLLFPNKYRVRAILGSTGRLGFGRRFRGVVRSH